MRQSLSSLFNGICAIARALDSDAGGADSFGPKTGAESYTTSTPCSSEFKAQALQMLQDPAVLCHVVRQDYAARWPDLKPPTLAECKKFCEAVSVAVTDQPATTES